MNIIFNIFRELMFCNFLMVLQFNKNILYPTMQKILALKLFFI